MFGTRDVQRQWNDPKLILSFRIDPSDPYEDVLGSLSGLPKLEDLSLTLGWSLDRPPTTLDGFSDLRALDLTQWRLFPSYLDAIERLVKRCSASLEILKLLPGTWPNNRWQWSDVHPETKELRNVPIRRITADVTFPRLQKLVVGCDGIHLAEFPANAYGSLTHLDIRSCTEEGVRPRFWASLRDAGIRLEALGAFPLSQAACDYLVSYAGLRTLRLCHTPGEFAAPATIEGVEGMANSVFNAVLPKHEETLQYLAFEGIKFEAFSLEEAKMDKVLECKKLHTLWAVYDHPAGRPYDTAHPDIVRLP